MQLMVMSNACFVELSSWLQTHNMVIAVAAMQGWNPVLTGLEPCANPVLMLARSVKVTAE